MEIEKTKKVWIFAIFSVVLISVFDLVCGVTDQKDFKVLDEFRKGVQNARKLGWPSEGNDPCGPPEWPGVYCSKGRVTQIQIQSLGVIGTLPLNFNQLDMLENVGLQNNHLYGNLPSFSGLSNLKYAYLDNNNFSTIPSDFFDGLTDIRVLALDYNSFNESTGWYIPSVLEESTQLLNFSCSGCNIVGSLPHFLGRLPSLSLLKLAYNRLSGELPASFTGSNLQILWLNNQDGGRMTGTIDVIGSMVGLTQVWIHGNQFTGSIPDSIGDLTSLQELKLNDNQLAGLIPPALANMNLRLLALDNNMFMGPIPKFKAANVSYAHNSFCAGPGEQCAPEVNALLDFLHEVNYPPNLATTWTGNDPCNEPWWGVTCSPSHHVSVINLQKQKLNGTLSASLANLDSLLEVHFSGNNLTGTIPANLTQLRDLRLVDLTGNNFDPPIPKFGRGVKVIIDGNPNLVAKRPPSPASSPSSAPPNTSPSPDSPSNSSAQVDGPNSPSTGSSSMPHTTNSSQERQGPENSGGSKLVVIVAAAAGVMVAAVSLGCLLKLYCAKKRAVLKKPPVGIVVHPKDSSNPSNTIKSSVSNNSTIDVYTVGTESKHSAGSGLVESGNLVASVHVLRRVTNNFAQENELGRGGFGAVYKGELDDGTQIAVKRMETGVVSNKALDEFDAEIAVLSMVRHRHLVSLLGYSIEGNERLLVYEYMPQGALSRHLFRWKSLNLEPLSWTRRLIIALDVARGMEYLHSLAQQSFIHRDLKSSNILLSNDFRAKVADFGLVKLAPDRERSVATRLAGTFGYLAPEYAVTGKITTKVDVFSFGVVLMEILTGLTALDEQRPEESRYLAEWFWQIKSDKDKLIAAVDPALDAKEDIFESIYIMAELAGHCTARDPNHRPEMGHAVNVLAQQVEKWKPAEETEDYSGIDFAPLPVMLKDWQQTDNSKDFSSTSQDSKGSIPPKPEGLADSFTSADAR